MRLRRHPTGPVEIREKHPLAIRWFHWVNFPVLFIMIWSGLMILWANNVFQIGGRHVISQESLDFPLAWYDKLIGHKPAADDHYTLGARLAEGMSWHFLVMWIFTINGALYVLYLAFSGAWRDLLPKPGSIRHALLTVLHDLHLRKEAPPADGYNGAQRFAYTGVIIMGFGSLISGLAIYKPMQLSGLAQFLGGYSAARFEHFWLMIGFCAFFLVHVVQVAKTGWNNFRSMITGKELVPVEVVETEVAA